MTAASRSPSAVATNAQAGATGAVAAVTVLVIAGAAALASIAMGHDSTLAGTTPVPWLLFPLAFVVTELAVVHLHLRHSEQTFSLSEVPLVLGLFFAAPAVLVGGRAFAVAVTSLHPRRRQRPVKVAFNLAVATVETAGAVLIFRMLTANLAADSDVVRFAALVAAVCGGLLGTLLVGTITWVNGRALPSAWVRIVGTATVSFAANASLGLLAVALVQSDRGALLYLVLVIGIVFLAYRGYSTVHRRNQDLELLHGFTSAVGGSLEVASTGQQLLVHARDMLRAGRADLLLDDGGPADEAEPGDEGVVESAGARALRTSLLGAGAGVLPRGTRDEAQRAYLDAIGAKDAVLVSLPADSDMSGTVIVADRVGDVFTFTAGDLRLLQTLVNHAGVALANARLVDRLTEQAAEREHEALHDPLTGLPNRTLFSSQLADAIAAPGAKAAVLLMDLNGFKDVNDTLGHSAGDLLLQDIGGRLQRALDSTGGSVARLGGDEFAVLLPGIGGELAAKTVAHEIMSVLQQQTTVGGLRVDIGASIGIALCPLHGDEAVALLRRADVAMYAAKESHGHIQIYTPERDYHSPQRLALAGELRSTIERGELKVVYQPKADLRTGRVLGVEALARWNHGERGFVPPEEFIAVAERSGVIRELTMHVLRTALKQCRTWRLSGVPMNVSVNLSARSLRADFPAQVEQILAETGVAAAALTLEITESSIMADPEHTGQILDELHVMGVNIAIDDFGTGYSSLTYLKRLPVDEIKIDKSFVLGMSRDEDDAAIVRSTVDLGRNLGLRVVAEGIEDRDTWIALTTLGCDMAQGYYLSTPVTPGEFDTWLRQRNSATGGTTTIAAPPTEVRLPPLDEQRGT